MVLALRIQLFKCGKYLHDAKLLSGLSTLRSLTVAMGRCIAKPVQALGAVSRKLASKSFVYMRKHPKSTLSIGLATIAGGALFFSRKLIANKMLSRGLSRNSLTWVYWGVKLGADVNMVVPHGYDYEEERLCRLL